LAQIPGLIVEPPETNLVYFDCAGTGLMADALAARVRAHGVLVSVMGPYRVRACTHLDVDAAMVDDAGAVIRAALS